MRQTGLILKLLLAGLIFAGSASLWADDSCEPGTEQCTSDGQDDSGEGSCDPEYEDCEETSGTDEESASAREAVYSYCYGTDEKRNTSLTKSSCDMFADYADELATEMEEDAAKTKAEELVNTLNAHMSENCINSYVEENCGGLHSVPNASKPGVFHSNINYSGGATDNNHLMLFANTIGKTAFVKNHESYLAYCLMNKVDEAKKVYIGNPSSPELARQVKDAANQPDMFQGKIGRSIDLKKLAGEPYNGDLRDYLKQEFGIGSEDYVKAIVTSFSIVSAYLEENSVESIDLKKLMKNSWDFLDDKGKVDIDEEDVGDEDSIYLVSDFAMNYVADQIYDFARKNDLEVEDIVNNREIYKRLPDDIKELVLKSQMGQHCFDSTWNTNPNFDEMQIRTCKQAGENGYAFPCANCNDNWKRQCKVYYMGGKCEDPEVCDVMDQEAFELKSEEASANVSTTLEDANLSDKKLMALEFQSRFQVILDAMLLEIRNNPEILKKTNTVITEGGGIKKNSGFDGAVDLAHDRYSPNPEVKYASAGNSGRGSGFDKPKYKAFLEGVKVLSFTPRDVIEFDPEEEWFIGPENIKPEDLVIEGGDNIGGTYFSSFEEAYKGYYGLDPQLRAQQNFGNDASFFMDELVFDLDDGQYFPDEVQNYTLQEYDRSSVTNPVGPSYTYVNEEDTEDF
jgi:hypothetical protein